MLVKRPNPSIETHDSLLRDQIQALKPHLVDVVDVKGVGVDALHEGGSAARLHKEQLGLAGERAAVAEGLEEGVELERAVHAVHEALVAVAQDRAHEAVGGRVVGARRPEQRLPHALGRAVVRERDVEAEPPQAQLQAGRVLVRAVAARHFQPRLEPLVVDDDGRSPRFVVHAVLGLICSQHTNTFTFSAIDTGFISLLYHSYYFFFISFFL